MAVKTHHTVHTNTTLPERPLVIPPMSTFDRNLIEWCVEVIKQKYPFPVTEVEHQISILDDLSLQVLFLKRRGSVASLGMRLLDNSFNLAYSYNTFVYDAYRQMGVANWMMRFKLYALYQHGIRCVIGSINQDNEPEKRLLRTWGWTPQVQIGEETFLWRRQIPKFSLEEQDYFL